MVPVTCEPAWTSWRTSRQKACRQPGKASIQASTRGSVVPVTAPPPLPAPSGTSRPHALARRESPAHGSGNTSTPPISRRAIRQPLGCGDEFAGRGAEPREPGGGGHNRRICAQTTSRSGRPTRAKNRRYARAPGCRILRTLTLRNGHCPGLRLSPGRPLTGAMPTNLSPRRPSGTRWCPTPGLDGPEWIGPAADHHRDLTALTGAVRGELDRAVRRVNATLGMADRHSYKPDPWCRRKCRIPCGNQPGPGTGTRRWPRM